MTCINSSAIIYTTATPQYIKELLNMAKELTDKACYSLGWAYCKLKQAVEKTKYVQFGDMDCMYPMVSFTNMNRKAIEEGVIDESLMRELADVISNVDYLPEAKDKRVLSIEKQGVWQLGFYHAMTKSKFENIKFDEKNN